MVSRARAVVVVVCIGVGVAAACGPAAEAAAIPTRAFLPFACAEHGASNEAVFACDLGSSGAPGRRRIALGADVRVTRERWDVAVGGSEPLIPGEHLVLDWPRPSARALLALAVRTPEGLYSTVLELRWRPEHVEVTVLADGALDVRSAARNAVVPVPRAYQPVVWRPRSARAAAERILDAVDHFTHSILAMKTMCAALDVTVGPKYGVDPAEPLDECLVAWFWFGDENVPRIRFSRHSGLSLRVRGTRAVLRTRLTHVFYRGDNLDRARASVTARVLLARDSTGIWRLATLDPLMPLYAAYSNRIFDDRDLAAAYRRDLASGRRWAARNARRRAAEQAASVSPAATSPCTVTTTEDPAGDVVVEQSAQVSRNPDAHLDVDLVATGRSSTCLALRTRGPLPATFEVDAGSFTVVVRDGRVLVVKDDAPVRGIAASLTGDALVVALPPGLGTSCGVELTAEVDGVDYGDRDACRAAAR